MSEDFIYNLLIIKEINMSTFFQKSLQGNCLEVLSCDVLDTQALYGELSKKETRIKEKHLLSIITCLS